MRRLAGETRIEGEEGMAKLGPGAGRQGVKKTRRLLYWDYWRLRNDGWTY